MDNRVFWRLFLFFVFLPFLIFLMLLDFGSHLILNSFIIVTALIASVEMRQLFQAKGITINPFLPPILGICLPILGYFEVLGWITPASTFTILAGIILLLFIRQIFTNRDSEIQAVLAKVSGSLFIVIYPGLFCYFLTLISSVKDASLAFVVFSLMTFGNDASAWLMGNLFGKKSSKPFVVSPNKSLIGFIGGLCATILVGVVAWFVLPVYFHSQVMGNNLFLVILFSILVGVATIIGDLFESALKRSAGVKDSGTIIPGRGGMLDSIDSLLFAAPVFYVFLTLPRSV